MHNKKSVDRLLIKSLLIDNINLNNVQITKLYNKLKYENNDPESFRKIIRSVRKEYNIPNVASKYTSKSLYNKTETYKVKDEVKDNYRWVKVDTEKGELKSEIKVSFEPRTHEELAKLHNVDLTQYKISNYWTKLLPDGKFTSSLLCSLRKLGDLESIDDVVKTIKKTFESDTPKITYEYKKNSSDVTLIIWVSDEHVGAAQAGNIYDNKYDANEYFKRKMSILDIIEKEYQKNGIFDNIIICSLGDNLDGFNGKTTRSLIGDSTHTLPQNMTNEEAIRTYVQTNRVFFDNLVKKNYTNKIKLYNINNSNHGGLGFDFSANYALEMYLTSMYGNLFEINQIHDIYYNFDLYGYKFLLTHGKDDSFMKLNLPLNLNDKVELKLNEYFEEIGKNKVNYKNIVVKGDLHQFATQQGKNFVYQNIPSLYGSSSWIHANFGKGNSGYCYSVIGKNDNTGVGFIPVWLK